ncbi:MAG: hypothetical protein H0V14_10165 [Chitinophagaceae bacterium]|nr:hypothetical protein [Chitinophagaceae bacterium]
MKKELIIEKDKTGKLWGRVTQEDNLIIENGNTTEQIETSIKRLLKKLHGIQPDEISFEHSYDLTALFEKFNFLKISAIAEHAQMNPALLRQYVSGVKNPSKNQAKKIENAIKSLGRQMINLEVFAA